ncbi:iron complex outermembrane receptor protein [Flavobacterium limicola]|uniref:Iron complex outermembrane receptor protein n=2 Tax=Flavobacterium limicola TaxID=180441 RepID=A0A495RT75_9FLAO|nr:iron complex outermembrane receptor protein [Flavobacterium limicola]
MLDGKVNNKTQARRPAFLRNKYRTLGKKSSEIMTTKKILLFCFLSVCQCVLAQNKPAISLNEVIVTDGALKKYSKTLQVQVLNDSVIQRNYSSLTNLLRYNSLLYLKEYGNGMTSSVSFRGTTAAQTAVIWNGININSQLLGQTDFNTITPLGYTNVSVRTGGGSGIYGSSAIGGSIHLNNELHFKKQFQNLLRMNFGSFNTQGYYYQLIASDEKVASQFSISRNSSDNDYGYPNSNQKNQNGDYYNTSLNGSFGYKINLNHKINFYSQVYDGLRHFSGTLASISVSKYYDLNTRNLLEWVGLHKDFTSKLKLAYVTENYKYYENKDKDIFSEGGAKTKIIKYDLDYSPTKNFTVNSVVDFTQINGFGTSINNAKRSIGAASLLVKHTLSPAMQYEASVRQEVATNYRNPFLYSFGLVYQPFEMYSIKLNTSKNFRLPSFNDLYWEGSGNHELIPELSNQMELGQELKINALKFSLTGFYIQTKGMIRWIPNETGQWMPINTASVVNKGVEVTGSYFKNFKGHNFNISLAYGYTSSVDQSNQKQLIYVPYHKMTVNADYSYKNWSLNYQYLFNGAVFTSADNYYRLKEYQVSNLSVYYKIGELDHYKIGIQALNLFNENYQTVEVRPMPGSNYNLTLTIKY